MAEELRSAETHQNEKGDAGGGSVSGETAFDHVSEDEDDEELEEERALREELKRSVSEVRREEAREERREAGRKISSDAGRKRSGKMKQERSAKTGRENPRKERNTRENRMRNDRGGQRRILRFAMIAVCVLLAVFLIVTATGRLSRNNTASLDAAESAPVHSSGTAESVSDHTGTRNGEEETLPESAYLPADDQNVEVTSFNPHAVDETKPTNLMSYSEINVDGETLEDKADYEAQYEIEFGAPGDYTDADGIVTFRGNPFRNDPTYGAANLTNNTIERIWSADTGTLTYDGKTWSGNGWTGQPLMTKWPKSVKEHMNMTDAAKEDDDLVEVIYASMDGKIYFLNLESGEATRDPMDVGWTFKGAGALDPRGWPILYVGAGYDSDAGTARVFVINLLDCSVMYTFGNNDSFSLRGSLSYFDSSALVDSASDTLIYPGENGILYLIHLNTDYDEEAGTLSINPDRIVKWHYEGKRTSKSSYWLGMEDSACIYKGYMFVADNGGNLMCINLNTLTFVWCQDTLDDTNCSPVLSVENDHLYLYISTSFHLGWRSDSTATVPIWKIDAETGEIIWQKDYECYSHTGVSGGVQSTIALGKYGLSDYIYVTVSQTGSEYGGVCAALRKDTGEPAWEQKGAYAWSSPVCVYNSDGTGHVLYASSAGVIYLLDGLTGEECDRYTFDETTIEASPAVYNNIMVLGTRDQEICGFRLG